LATDKFSARYLDVTDKLTLQNLDFEVLSSLTNPKSAQVAYNVIFHTNLFGDLKRQMTMNLVLENSVWKVQWDDSLILPELKADYHLALDVKIPTRSDIYASSGKTKTVVTQTDAVALGVVPGEIDQEGTLLNQSRLASSLGVSAPAVGRYIDILADLLLVRRLRSWSGNLGKRLVRAPKVYVRDSGLLHALVELETWNDVVGHPLAGPSWEGFVIENLIATAGDRRVPFFFRTEDGAEIDLMFERGGRVELAIEIKRTTAPEVSKGFRLACAALRPRHAYVVHGGTDEWPMRDGVTAISLVGLMKRLESAH